MIRNYLTTAFRNILRHKGYSAINILGLAVGLACAFFIVIWMQDEISYDRFHEDGDRTYAVMRHSTFGGNKGTTRSIPKPLAAALVDNYPEITETILVSWGMEMLLALEDESFRSTARYAGPDFFNVFTFPLIIGDAEKALQSPESVVISSSMAEMYFGTDWQKRDDVLGTIFQLENRLDVTLTGVFEDVPSNSTLQFDFIVPIEEYIRRNDWVEAWDNNGLRMFARLTEGADVAAVNAKIIGLINENVDSYESELFLYPYSELYLRSDFENGVLVGGRIEYIKIFGLVGLFIILIASINFMNLATARSTQRAREIGVRKSVGATRSVLARQFLGESVFKSSLAFVFALGLIVLFMSSFNTITQKSILISSLGSMVWLQFAGIALLTGLLAGSYPALYLSSFSVSGVFRSNAGASGRGSGLRKGLVVLQFVMSIVLIVGTFTVYRQLDFIRSKDLGVDRENVVMLGLEGGVRDQYDTFKQELLQAPGVLQVARASNNPLSIGNDTIGVQWEGKDPDNNQLFWNSAIGYDFVEAMGITMDAGRHFSRDFGTDSSNYVVNWKAAEAMGMDDPVGQQISFWGREGTIVGVMEDFHMSSMYRPITPVIFRLRPDQTDILFVRVAAGQTSEALAAFEGIYKQFNPEYPFDFEFMDAEFESAYRSEVVMGTLANVFAFVAILIACLGLFGLASFTAEQRTREIGIRKVLGASVPSVVMLLSREFILLVGGAFVVAAPFAYIIMNKWLEEFAFHTELGIGILAGAGISAILIAWLTVGYQAVVSAVAAPVDSLRSD